MPGKGGEEDEEDRKDVFLPSHRLPHVDLKLRGSLSELMLCLRSPETGHQGAKEVIPQCQDGQWGLWRLLYPDQSPPAALAASVCPARLTNALHVCLECWGWKAHRARGGVSVPSQ